ncbi:disulfide bond formation protein DsbB [uncultured Paraglaciecola sp.]|uniref:disulfide bond formation protein DsbB n=1 Tax=uncultured Paraglaciecola sp. TaxID=1765024 RepID=UPI0030DADF19|tara:strand:+ start:4995 stop:5510 length:516 start_codon:yes stop_codon:yes gene_type:complete
MNYISNLPDNRLAWGLLFLSSLVLEAYALFSQHAMDLQPCIMCIYQRTAIFGIMFACIPVLITNNVLTRLLAFTLWGVSAIWGGLIAFEHYDIQTAANPFFATCEIVPNFPSWLPLHEWLPNIFAATGDCGNIDWEFMDMSMPQWMMVVFAIYTVIWLVVLLSRLAAKRML